MDRLPDGRIPVVLSAHADELVAADAGAIAEYLERRPETTVAQVARQLRTIRRVRRHRAVLRATDRAELLDGLRALAAGREHPLVARSALSAAPRRAFVFPGQGRHWPGMGAVAYETLPAYRAAVDGCVAAFESAGVESPLRYLTAAGGAPSSEIEIQGAQFAHAVGLAEVWRACGVLPDLTVGQSLGEVAAAFVAGCIALAGAVAVVAARAAVVDRLPGRYAMATLGIGAPAAEALIAATDGWVELSVVYSDSTVAVSGDREAVLAVTDAVRAGGGFAREIAAGFPGHTSLLERLRDDLLARLPACEITDGAVPFIGGTTGQAVAPGTPFADYWYANLRSTVRMDRAFGAAIGRGARSFIELSPHPALLFSVGQLLEADGLDEAVVLVGSAHRGEPLADALSENIVTAAVADPGHRWGDDAGTAGAGLQGFPNAPMRATPMWAHPEPLMDVPGIPAALTVALEHWEQTGTVPTIPARPVQIAVIDIEDGPLTRPLRAAIEAHPAGRPGAPAEAEIVVVLAPPIDEPDPCRAADALTRLVGSGQLDYARTPGPRCHTVCLVTVGAERVGRHDGPAAPGQAALAAIHRSIGFDWPAMAFTHLDLALWDLAPEAGRAVVDALLSGTDEAALRDAGRGCARFERSLRDAPAVAHGPLTPGMVDDVVITGGAGTVGLHYARYLAERGARRIVLLSRRPAAHSVLRTLAASGAEVVSPPCDVTDASQLAAAAAEYGGGGASLVVHAAGGATFDALTPAAFADTVAAKVTGLARLLELWPIRPEARMVLCSSVSGVWGGRGHAAYSAANRLLDVLAAQLRAAGRDCVAMRWGLWQGPIDGNRGRGIADAAGVADVERSGLRPMAPREAIEASLRGWTDDPLVYAADANRLRIFLASRRSPVSDCAPPDAADATVSVADAVRTQLAAVLGVAGPAQIDLADSLFDLGVDSMLAVDLRRRLNRTIGRTVSLATLMGEITGDELVDKLEGADERTGADRKVGVA